MILNIQSRENTSRLFNIIPLSTRTMQTSLTAEIVLEEENEEVAVDSRHALEHKLLIKEAVIGIVGLGYVGLPLAMAFSKEGFKSHGVDLNVACTTKLNAGQSHIQDVSSETVREAVDAGLFGAANTYDEVGRADVIFVCVPTPVTHHKNPDTRYIESATRSIAEHLRPGQLVVLKSTTFPNTTEELVQPILEEAAASTGMVLGKDYFLAFSPERVDPGNQTYHTGNTPVIVGGVTEACTELASLAMQQAGTQVHPVSSPRVAEMGKLLENIFRSANIALVNELARLCDRMGGISIWEVVEAAATKPFGFMPFYPGPGIGGHCIPVDPYYLSWLARKYDFETSFITLSARINEEMPFYISNAVLRAIAANAVDLRHAKVLILGVAFKKDVDDTRHAPATKVIEILHRHGVENINFSDPHVPTFSVELPAETVQLESIDISEEVLKEHEVVVILTDHTAFPYAQIAEHAHVIVDTRNAMKRVPYDRQNVILLGGGEGMF